MPRTGDPMRWESKKSRITPKGNGMFGQWTLNLLVSVNLALATHVSMIAAQSQHLFIHQPYSHVGMRNGNGNGNGNVISRHL